MGSPKGAQDVKNTGFWPGIAEMQKKGKISVSLDSCILSYRGVCMNAHLGSIPGLERFPVEGNG